MVAPPTKPLEQMFPIQASVDGGYPKIPNQPHVLLKSHHRCIRKFQMCLTTFLLFNEEENKLEYAVRPDQYRYHDRDVILVFAISGTDGVEGMGFAFFTAG